ncbi:unnamed protein product [Boreogadus saida]
MKSKPVGDAPRPALGQVPAPPAGGPTSRLQDPLSPPSAAGQAKPAPPPPPRTGAIKPPAAKAEEGKA